MTITATSSTVKVGPVVGKVPRLCRHRLLARHRAGDGDQRREEQEAPDQHGEAAGHVVQVGVACSGPRRPSRCCRSSRCRRTGSRVSPCGPALRIEAVPHVPSTATAAKSRMLAGEIKQGQAGHLDLEALDLLAQVLRRAAHHQPGDEHGQDGVHQHAVEPGADPAEDDLAGGRCWSAAPGRRSACSYRASY